MAHERHSDLVARGKEIVQNAPQLYIDLDVESDGCPGYGSLLSVGAVSPWGEEFYRELRPVDGPYVPGNREFCAKHGLEYERLIDEGVEPSVAMQQLTQWQQALKERHGKTGASVLVAFNASYDFPMINLEYLRAGISNPFGVAGYCLKSLAIAVLPQYDWSMTAKSKLSREIMPEGDFTHNALEDAIWQQELHFALVAKLSASFHNLTV